MMNINRTIVVEGNASLFVSPDFVELSMWITTFHENYQSALQEASLRQQTLLQTFSSQGFPNVETSALRINPIYQKDNPTLVEGYQVVNQLTLGIPYQEEKLNRAISAIQTSQVPVEFQISFTIADEKPYQTVLLTQAVEHAYQTAHILTNASHTTLGEVLKIDSSNPFIRPYSRMQLNLTNMATIPFSFQPEKIMLTSRVIMTWNLL